MAFYTANYIKKLLKDDEANIRAYLKNKDNTFRNYIDATLPFTLYLDIDMITKKVVTQDAKFIKDLVAEGIKNDINYNVEVLIANILDCYKKTIYYYNTNFPSLTSDEISSKLKLFQESYTTNTGENTKQLLKALFDKTYVSHDIGSRQPYDRALVISPSFYTIQKKFGDKFKEIFEATNTLSDSMSDISGENPKKLAQKFLSKNFGTLQNLGHVEADVISSTSSEVKRGIVTPKLIAALAVLPKDARKLEDKLSLLPKESNTSKLARQFSKETGQGSTRVVIRKKFAGSKKLVIEMFVEAGFLFGTVESQAQNLGKSGAEQSFKLGAGLAKAIRDDDQFLLKLETSKSLFGFIGESVLGALKGTKVADYSSTADIKQKFTFTRTKVTVKPPKLPKTVLPPVSTLRNLQGRFTSVASIESILNQRLSLQIKQNMGDGDRTDILNYRTGRFAESAKIEYVSRSRNDMLTVFYNYMKYPYATFSAGGARSNPKTRDPKLLISKSIRDIAGGLVANRLRAVAV